MPTTVLRAPPPDFQTLRRPWRYRIVDLICILVFLKTWNFIRFYNCLISMIDWYPKAEFDQNSNWYWWPLFDMQKLWKIITTKVYWFATSTLYLGLQYFQMINWFVERKLDDQISIGKEYEAKITLPIGKIYYLKLDTQVPKRLFY